MKGGLGRTPVALATLVLLLHVAVNATSPYGFHRDEFLYLAMGRHLRLWTMDFPPFIAILARLTLETIGGSLVAVRLLPALVHALLMVLAARTAHRLGGGGLAQTTAALAVAASPLFMRAGNLFQPVIFDQLWWTLALVALMRIPTPDAGDPDVAPRPARAWLLLGAALGVGLLTKYSIAFIGVGIVAGVLLTALRRWLLTPWPWLAVVLAVALGSPSIVGQIRLDYPVLAQMADLRGSQLERIGPLAFVVGNLEFLGPLALLAIAGAAELLGRERSPAERAAAWAAAVTFVLLMLLRGKAYYVGPVYPILFAGGGVWLERRAPAVRWAAVGVIAAFGLVTLPFGVPALPPVPMARYAAAAGLGTETNRGERIALPQDYADMLGWEEQAAATAQVYDALPAADRNEVVIVGTNYGRAGAHDHLATRLGLPPAVAPMGSYWFFGPGDKPGAVAIVIGGDREDLLPFYQSVEEAARVTGALRVPEEREVVIWLARRPVAALQEIWAEFEGRN